MTYLLPAIACEMLARKIVTKLPVEKLYAVMSDRLMFQENDGDEGAFASALETAIDQHACVPAATVQICSNLTFPSVPCSCRLARHNRVRCAVDLSHAMR